MCSCNNTALLRLTVAWSAAKRVPSSTDFRFFRDFSITPPATNLCPDTDEPIDHEKCNSIRQALIMFGVPVTFTLCMIPIFANEKNVNGNSIKLHIR